jgi:NhaP-type Na+/H+ or K+/H+ antiporter
VLGLELVVVLGATILLCNLAAGRLRVAPPILLLACGALLGFVPALRSVQLPPEVVLLLFLPALLYRESVTISLQLIRSNLRGIVLTGTLLVIVTAGAVAVAVHALGLGWPVAWVLGAAVAPTDATAVSEFAKSLPHRNITVLQAESLVNDGTALVVYALAVGVTTGSEHLALPHVGWLFVLAYGGGALAGALVACIVAPIRKRLDDKLQNNVAILVTPFAAFLLADSIHASGVLAVVVCGLIMGQLGPQVSRADTRQQTEEALAALSDVAEALETDPNIVERLRREYDKHLRVLQANANASTNGDGDGEGTEDEEALRYDRQYTELRLAMLARKRATVLRLRHERRIDDSVLLRVQSRLDLEEMRLSRRPAAG